MSQKNSKHLFANHLSANLLTTFLVALCISTTAALPTVPASRQPVTNTYHATSVVDDYQWLEQAGTPSVREWSRLQNERTRGYFAGLPYREGIAQQLLQLRSEESARIFSIEHKQGNIF